MDGGVAGDEVVQLARLRCTVLANVGDDPVELSSGRLVEGAHEVGDDEPGDDHEEERGAPPEHATDHPAEEDSCAAADEAGHPLQPQHPAPGSRRVVVGEKARCSRAFEAVGRPEHHARGEEHRETDREAAGEDDHRPARDHQRDEPLPIHAIGEVTGREDHEEAGDRRGRGDGAADRVAETPLVLEQRQDPGDDAGLDAVDAGLCRAA